MIELWWNIRSNNIYRIEKRVIRNGSLIWFWFLEARDLWIGILTHIDTNGLMRASLRQRWLILKKLADDNRSYCLNMHQSTYIVSFFINFSGNFLLLFLFNTCLWLKLLNVICLMFHFKIKIWVRNLVLLV